MAHIVNVADIHRVEKVDMGTYTHERRPLRGVRIHVKLTNEEILLIERGVGTDNKSVRAVFGPQWHYTRFRPTGGILGAVYDISDNPWGLADTNEIAKKAFTLVKTKLKRVSRQRAAS